MERKEGGGEGKDGEEGGGGEGVERGVILEKCANSRWLS